MVRVKICGLTRERDLRAAVDAGADAVGFISEVDVDTARELAPERARELADAAPPFVTTVLVTMPDEPADAVALAETVGPDVVQLHCGFDADAVATVRAETGLRVVPVVAADEADRARELDAVADAVLVDSVSEEGGGGTGRTHDWDRSRRLARELDSPVVLAGGLDPDNVADAVGTVRPFGVDVASGVEAEGGVKDHEAVRRFVRAAGRELDREVAREPSQEGSS